ncbi:MAG: hypothetical protein ABIP51_15200 [Bacteroidia bacterium]
MDFNKIENLISLENKGLYLIKCQVAENKYWITDKKAFLKIKYEFIIKLVNEEAVCKYLIKEFKRKFNKTKYIKPITYEEFYDKFSNNK